MGSVRTLPQHADIHPLRPVALNISQIHSLCSVHVFFYLGRRCFQFYSLLKSGSWQCGYNYCPSPPHLTIRKKKGDGWNTWNENMALYLLLLLQRVGKQIHVLTKYQVSTGIFSRWQTTLMGSLKTMEGKAVWKLDSDFSRVLRKLQNKYKIDFFNVRNGFSKQVSFFFKYTPFCTMMS